MRKIILGIAGEIASGKDTVGQYIKMIEELKS